ncbi:hypothetical protein [Planomonospora algeriensis]
MTAEAMPEELAENARTSASPSYWFHLVGVFWRLSPWKVALTGLLSWVSAAVPGLQVALTAQAVGGVAAELTGRGQGRDQVVFAISAMVALAVTTHVLGAVQRYLGAVLALELTMKISEMVMVKGTRMDLESYENADYYDRLERAKAESGSGNAYEILKQIVDTVAALVTLVSISVALFSWHPWAALLTLLSPLPATAVNAFYGKREWQVEYDRAQERRKSFYYQWITTSDHSFMEIKLFGLGSYFIGRYRELIDSFFRVDSRLAAGRSCGGPSPA